MESCNICNIDDGTLLSSFRSNQLQRGDRVLMVNGNTLNGLNLNDALQTLRTSDRFVRLVVARSVSIIDNYPMTLPVLVA